MMKFVIRFLPVLLLLSCSKEADEIEILIKKDSCKRNISFNEHVFTSVKKFYEEAGTHPVDSVILADCKKIVSWRRNFMNERNIENLLLYSDSVEARYSKYSGASGELLYPIQKLKNQFNPSVDSLKYYNLLYLTTVAEGELLNRNAASLGVTDGHSLVIPSYSDREKYRTTDTVFLTLSADDTFFANAGLDFSQVTCRRAEDGVNLKPKVIKSGPHYILLYNPDEEGAYTVGGMVILKQEGNFDTNIRIENKFEVKNTAPNNI